MQQRHVRLSVPGTDAKLDWLAGQLVDLSLSGALVELNGEVEVGHQTTLVLSKDPLVLELAIRVVRTTAPAATFPSSRAWLVAVAFLQMSDAAKRGLVRSLARAATRR